MPVALLEGCVTSSGCPTRTALSAPFHHLLSLVKAALQTHNPYSLQIPLDKVSSPITLPAAHMVSLGSSDKPNASVRQPRTLLPTTSAPLPFFWQSWEDSLTLHAQQFLLTSLSPPHYCCFPAWLPPSLNPSLPSAPLYVQLQLGSSLHGPSDSPQQRSNAISVCDFKCFFSKHYIPTNPAMAHPTPRGVSNESVTISRLPGFIPAICYPSRYFYCTSGCAIPASETAAWGVLRTSTKARGND